MDSTAFLRRGVVPNTPPLPTTTAAASSGLPLTFRRNVSSIRLFAGKANENNKKHMHIRNNNKYDSEIRCLRFNKMPSGSRSRGFPSPNAKLALQSMLCFSLDTTAEDHTKLISAHKKKALQLLLDEKRGEAERTMLEVYKKYQKGSSGQIKYDATLALVEILIHLGTVKSLDAAIGHMNDLEQMTDSPSSDAKRSLYRAIIYTLLEENGEAQSFWNKYSGSIGSGPPRR